MRPVRVEVFQREIDVVIVYLFPLSAEISKQDRRIRFEAQIGRIVFAQDFDSSEMEFLGKLELRRCLRKSLEPMETCVLVERWRPPVVLSGHKQVLLLFCPTIKTARIGQLHPKSHRTRRRSWHTSISISHPLNRLQSRKREVRDWAEHCADSTGPKVCLLA